jgi:hypothetical protein
MYFNVSNSLIDHTGYPSDSLFFSWNKQKPIALEDKFSLFQTMIPPM